VCPPSNSQVSLGEGVAKKLVRVPMRSSTRSRRTPIAYIPPPQQIRRAGGPSSHATRQKGSKKTSRLHEKSYPSDHEEQDLLRCQECARKQRTMTVEISYAREENGEKSDPRVRFLVKECVPGGCQMFPQLVHCLTKI
jgi:hypothetical protein